MRPILPLAALLTTLLFPAAAKAESPASPSTDAINLQPIAPEGSIADLPAEVQSLLADMKTAAEKSAAVFEPLSTEQLDFRPEDGTHTPRWNAEHLAGAQMMFFSKMYHSIDDRIPVIDQMPKQMPEDYTARNPTYDGKQEAARIRDADAYARRYAYLLKNVDMDAPVQDGVLPPFFKSNQSLITILTGHYGEHTANVVKKFDAPGYPAD